MFSTGNNIDELLGLSGWKIEKYELDENSSTVYLYLSPEIGYTYECLHCRTGVLFCHDHCAPRQVRDLSLWGYSCFLVFSRGRIYCPECKRVVMEYLDWVEPYQRQTTRYEKYVAGLCDYMPVMDVAEIEQMGKNLVYRIDKKWLDWRNEMYKRNDPVRHLGIDEIAVKKNHKYATVFYDLERSRVIGLVKGRKQRNVSSFFRRWGKENCRNVEAVCTDLWSAFHNSINIYLKQAQLVFDKFHIFKYLSDALEDVRRTEQNILNEEDKKLLKGCRWLILKRKLTRYKDKQKLREIMALNENIMKAILLKEAFYQFYEASNAEEAMLILKEWTDQCTESGLAPFKKLARRLNRWKSGILAFFETRISNGISEGINNKIKVIKRRSYGFHDERYFFLKILNATGMFPNMQEIAHPRNS